jgi:hypothetical protein
MKFIKNELRNKVQKRSPYIPQYQEQGLEPTISNFPKSKFQVPSSGIPNVGNMDEEEYDPNHPMIDNNDYVTIPGEDVPQNNQLDFNPSDVEEGMHLVFVEDVLICGGTSSQVEKVIYDLATGAHKDYDRIPINKISVFKKMKLKTGIFLE